MNLDWLIQLGKFLCRLERVAPLDFFNFISGFNSDRNCPLIYMHGEGIIEVIGKDRHGRSFVKQCQSIEEAEDEWKLRFDIKNISEVSKIEERSVTELFCLFSGNLYLIHDLPSIFSINKKIFVVGRKVDFGVKETCKNISEAVKIWKRYFGK